MALSYAVFVANRKPGFVVCGISLSRLKPCRASGLGMWRMKFRSTGGDTECFFKRTTRKVNVI